MPANRMAVLLSIARGLLTAILLTLLGMAVIAALTVFAHITDGVLTLLNQLLKIAAIALGLSLIHI